MYSQQYSNKLCLMLKDGQDFLLKNWAKSKPIRKLQNKPELETFNFNTTRIHNCAGNKIEYIRLERILIVKQVGFG